MKRFSLSSTLATVTIFIAGVSCLLVVAVESGCAAPTTTAQEEQRATSSNINGGRATRGSDEAVGLIAGNAAEGGVSICTGSLIAPTVVLTAAHCINQNAQVFVLGDGAPTPLDGDFAKTINAMEPRFTITEGRINPGWTFDQCPSGVADVGVLRLEKPVRGVTPLRPSRTPPRRGALCRAVGYGFHLRSDGTVTALQKREALIPLQNTTASALTQVDLLGGMIPGPGDSGGPLFCDGSLDGTIFGTDSCGSGHTRDDRADQKNQAWGRVDAADFIDAALADWAE